MKQITQEGSIEKYAQIGKISHELFHDILNPITGLILYLEIFDKNKTIPKNQIDEIKDSSCRIRSFLKLIQDNLLYPNKKVFLTVDNEIREIIKLVYYRAKKNNVSIIYLNNTKEKILFSKINFYQLIINLLSNAIDSFENIKDSRKRKVIIKSESFNKYLRITINDNGCGIPKNQTNLIFKNGYSNKNQGFGIGLRTVKKIMEQNKGKIEIESLGKNKGSKFIIFLPKNR